VLKKLIVAAVVVGGATAAAAWQSETIRTGLQMTAAGVVEAAMGAKAKFEEMLDGGVEENAA